MTWNDIADTFLSLQASFRVLLENWRFFVTLLILQCAFAALISKALAELRQEKETLVTLAFVGGILGAALFGLIAAALKIQPTPLTGSTVLLVSLTVIAWQRRFFKGFSSAKWFFVFGSCILLLRLIFIQGLIVPPYADSVTHLRIVEDLLHPSREPRTFYRLAFDLRHYYHIGFHAFAAWLSKATSTAPPQAILLLGQYFQAMAVLSIYPLARILFRNSHSAWVSLIVSCLILPTPAYASNWGKFPAIACMAGINFVFSLLAAYGIGKTKPSKAIWLLIGFAVLSTTGLHSRSLAAVFIAFSLFFFAPRAVQLIQKIAVDKTHVDYEGIIATILSSLVLAFLLLVKESPVPMWIVLIVAVLLILAFYGNFNLTAALAALMILMGAGYFTSAQWLSLPVRFGRILDYPFLAIFAFIPLSLLAELGIEGGLRLFPPGKSPYLRRQIVAFLLVTGFANVAFLQNQHPSECCIFLKDDDLFAFGWMEKNLPANALVGIAASGQSGNFLPSDGGAWIGYYTSIPTRKLDFNLDFYKETENLCRAGIEYLYIDNLANSFDEYNLAEAGGLFQFGLGSVRIYRLNCNRAERP